MESTRHDNQTQNIALFLGGDVMTGRGIDQILPHPCDPRIHEAWLQSALGYVDLAEQCNGPIDRPADYSYIWGDALVELGRFNPDARIINLETAVTTSDSAWPGKGIHYRMHPKNLPCVTAAKIDVCVLANNHVLDWGYAGLDETLLSLTNARIQIAGAGNNIGEAEAPAVLKVANKGRIIVFAFGTESSGIFPEWQATTVRPGINFLPDFSQDTLRRIQGMVTAIKKSGDVVVASIHWGGNWDYSIPRDQQAFAHRLIDEAEIDIIHGHSSHHPKGVEIYDGKLILYGCGDFLNDYEGISGYESYRGDLSLMYFVTVESLTGRLVSLELTPMQTKNFSKHFVTSKDALWLEQKLEKVSKRLGSHVHRGETGTFFVTWE